MNCDPSGNFSLCEISVSKAMDNIRSSANKALQAYRGLKLIQKATIIVCSINITTSLMDLISGDGERFGTDVYNLTTCILTLATITTTAKQ